MFALFGFTLDNKGKTSGSRVVFEKGEIAHTVHKPHPGNIMLRYVLKQVYNLLKSKDLIK
ncbi:MAG: type II toxin-antitoxin system HicA family toxin [Tannerella sp.]|nr:type II toxin-antitoxin system HicA family toxin [Tannerella sp.]